MHVFAKERPRTKSSLLQPNKATSARPEILSFMNTTAELVTITLDR